MQTYEWMSTQGNIDTSHTRENPYCKDLFCWCHYDVLYHEWVTARGVISYSAVVVMFMGGVMNETTYQTEAIEAYMFSVLSEHINGYNELDKEGLIRAAFIEMGNGEPTIPFEFLMAYKRVIDAVKKWN